MFKIKNYRFFITYEIVNTVSKNPFYFKIGVHIKGIKVGMYIDTLYCRTWTYLKRD